MKTHLNISFVSIAVCIMSIGCAPSVTHLEKHLASSNFEKALEMVADDPAMQIELAALILERAASQGIQTTELISVLKGSGSPGERALKRLTEKAPEPAKSQALIAIIGRRAPEGKELEKYLEHDHSDVRADSICAWNKELSLDRLALMILDTDHRVRRCAVEGIVSFETQDKSRVQKLIGEALRLDPDASVRSAAAKAGKALGEDAFFKLKDALGDENMGVQLAALQGLSEIGDETILVVLEELSAGPMDEIAIAAASELSRLGHDAGKQRLLLALEDSRPGMRQAALLRTERARIKNRDKLFVAALEDEAPSVVLMAASTLLKKEAFKKPVAKALKRIADLGLKASNEARDMLAVLGDKDYTSKVEQALESAGTEEIVRVLGRVKRSSGLTGIFVQLMSDERRPIRIAASSAVLASTKDRK